MDYNAVLELARQTKFDLGTAHPYRQSSIDGVMTVKENIVTLQEFTPSDIELLAGWLEQPHVQPWYPTPEEDIQNAEEQCEQAADSDSAAGHFLIMLNDRAVGYIRWQLVPKEILNETGLTDVPGNSADVDLLIGDSSQICKGIGGQVLVAIEDALRARGDVPAIGLTTSKENHYAHKAFEKSGYCVAAEYSPGNFGACYLFLKRIDA